VSYTILRTNGSLLTTIADNTLNTTSTPLSLPGRNYASYGQVVDTNFVHQLENFADSTPPTNSLKGQLWFNTTNDSLYICPTDGESNVANWYLVLTYDSTANFVGNNLSLTGNITANNASITNDLDANSISTNYLTVNISANINDANLSGSTIANSITTNNITTGSNSTAGTLTGNWSLNGALSSNGNISTPGIKTDNYYYANGDPVNFDGTYGDSNVAAYLPTYVGNVGDPGNSTIFNGRTLSAGSNLTTGTITGNWTLSAGSKINGLSDIDGANITGTVANATYAVNADVANTVSVNAQPNITSVGTLTALSVSGNVSFTGEKANLGPVGNVVITGGSSGQVLSTNGSGGLSWVSAAAADTAITVTANAQPNITSVGTLTSLNVSGAATVTGNISSGNLSTGRIAATGNVAFTGANISLGSNANVRITGGSSGDVLSTDGAGGLSWVPTGTATTAQTVTNNAQPNITSVGTLSSLDVTGNVIAGNVYANAGTIGASLLRGTLTTTAQPNVVSLGTLTGLTVSGNATFTGPVVTLGTAGNLRITGGTSGQVLTSSGSGLVTWTSPSTSATTAITVTGNSQPNITSVGTLSSLGVSGTVTASSFSGSGAGLSSITGANVTGTVASANTATTATRAGTVTTNAQPNITSVGTLTSLVVSGNTTSGNISAANINATNSLTRAGQPVISLADFTQGSRWARMPNGLIMQFGTGSVNADGGQTFIAYPTAFSVNGSPVVSGVQQTTDDGRQAGPGVISSSNFGFTVYCGRGTGSVTFWWVAVGF
jgi:hypothetical protein